MSAWTAILLTSCLLLSAALSAACAAAWSWRRRCLLAERRHDRACRLAGAADAECSGWAELAGTLAREAVGCDARAASLWRSINRVSEN